MLFELKETEQTPRLFQNNLLEILSRTPPAVVVIIYLPIVIWLLWYSIIKADVGVWQTALMFVAGAPVWTFTEYWLHRTIMHWVPNISWGARMHFWVHGIHHDWPHDPYRLVMPPAISLTLFFIFLGIFSLLFGKFCWAFQAGFTLGYIIYDLSHYFFHHAKPRYNWLKSLQRHHLQHHFNPKYDDIHYAITVPIWDRFFGTLEPVETSAPKKTEQNTK